MPIAAVTGQTLGFQRYHCPDLAFADRGQQLLEARSGCPAAGSAEIVIDDLNVIPAKLTARSTRPYWRRWLSKIIDYLVSRRLTHIDEGVARWSTATLFIASLLLADVRRLGGRLRHRFPQQRLQKRHCLLAFGAG